jgi:glycosyltransferase involved in cell wall biosynthesis
MRISVVIPVFNEAEILDRCLTSVAAQTRPPDEIIVVDNNCTDQSMTIAAGYQHVRIVRQPILGIMPSTALGFDHSRGDLIVRCDADSIVPPSWLANIELTFHDTPSLIALTGPGSFYGCHRLTALIAEVVYMQAYIVLTHAALSHPPLFGSNFAIRREKWDEIKRSVHANRADIHDDMEISIHLDPRDHVIYDPRLRVGISGRALQIRGIGRRVVRGFRTLLLHWPDQAPWRRWSQRLRTQR